MGALIGILIAIAAVAVIIGAVRWFVQRRRRRALRGRFGPEYDRSVESGRSRRKAEAELAERAKHRDELKIRPLSPAARERYAEKWSEIQARFVDRPETAVVEADDLVTQVLRERGYPADDFESQAELVSVDHPDVVQKYRTAHEICTRTGDGTASTEDRRQALVAYRAFFEELLTNGARSERDVRS